MATPSRAPLDLPYFCWRSTAAHRCGSTIGKYRGTLDGLADQLSSRQAVVDFNKVLNVNREIRILLYQRLSIDTRARGV